jgi:WD40 repeat protein
MTNYPRQTLLVLWALPVAAALGGAAKGAAPHDGFRQLGKLRASLAYRALEQERSPVKASLFYLQAAQAFGRAGDHQGQQRALVKGLVAAQPLRASWVSSRWFVAASFLPGDKQVLTCRRDGRVHVRDVKSRAVRSFQLLRTRTGDSQGQGDVEWAGEIQGASFSPKLARLVVWEGRTLQLWDVSRGRLLRKWDRPWRRASQGRRIPVQAGAVFLPGGKRLLLVRVSAEGMAVVQLWDAAAGKVLVRFRAIWDVSDFSQSTPAGVFNRDQTRILTWPSRSAYLLDAASGVRLKWFRHPGTVRGAAFTRDESGVLTWGSDGTARLWESSLPRPLSPDDQLLELEVRSGLWLDEAGELRRLKREQWQQRRKKLAAILRKKGRP